LRAVDLENEENGLVLFWDMSTADDLAGYVIYRFGDQDGEVDMGSPDSMINISDAISYIDLNLTDGEVYHYGIVAVDLDGSFDPSGMNVISGSPVDDVPPARIDKIDVELLEPDEFLPYRFLVSWNTSSDGRFSEYRIYRSRYPLQDVGDQESLKVIDVRETFSFEDLDFESRVRYFYTVTVVDITGNEETEMLVWADGIYIPEAPPPQPPGEKEDGNLIFYLGVASVIFLLFLGGASYTTFILQSKKSHYGDEE
jgi:hypothetical protein